MITLALAGAGGAITRYLIELTGVNGKANSSPWSTMLSNVLGCFLAGAAIHAISFASGVELSTNLLIGFCGGLTTFSSAFAVPLLFEKRDKYYGYFLIALTPALSAGAFLVAITIVK
ncbi:MAG: CrcB family protein [Actinomycetota bacterium]